MSCVSALSFSARLSVIVATAPSICRVTSSDMLFLRQLQTQRHIAKQSGIHGLQIRIDLQRKIGEVEHVALEIYARSDLADHQRIDSQIDYAALGDISNVLAALACHVPAKRNVLHGIDELAASAFLDDRKLAAANVEL